MSVTTKTPWYRSAFRSAVLGGVVAMSAGLGNSVMAEGEAAVDKADEPTPAQVFNDIDSSVYDALWNKLVTEHLDPFHDDATQAEVPNDNADITVVMTETTRPDFNSLTLLSPDYEYDFFEVKRHGEAGALIIQTMNPGDDVNVHYIEREISLTDWIYDVNSDEARALFLNADVVALSMGWPTKGDQQKNSGAGSVDTVEEVELSDAFWERSRTIFVKSAGNYADEYANELERENAHHTLRADTYLPVGEVRWTEDGSFVIDYSSRVSSIAFVTTNPFYTGFESRYVSSEDDYRQELDRFFDTPVREGVPMTAKQTFMQMIRVLPDEMLVWRLQACHSDFDDAEFKGKEHLEKDVEWIRKHPRKVFEAFKNGVVASMVAQSQKYIAHYKNTGQLEEATGLISDVPGTSFSGPQGAAIVTAGLKAAVGSELTEYDVVAAALIASEPITDIKTGVKEGKPVIGTLRYVNNGCGVPFNSSSAGYGELTKDNIEHVIEQMKVMLAEDPSLKTKYRAVDSGVIEFDAKDGLSESPNYRDYTIAFGEEDDVTALSTHLVLDFNCSEKDIPLKLTLISPSGGHINLSPTRVGGSDGEDNQVSLGREIGHFGNDTAGEWTIRLHHGPHDITLNSARLTVKGMEQGNVVDVYLDRFGGELPTTPFADLEAKYAELTGSDIVAPANDDTPDTGTSETPKDPADEKSIDTPKKDPVKKPSDEQDNVAPTHALRQKAAVPAPRLAL